VPLQSKAAKPAGLLTYRITNIALLRYGLFIIGTSFVTSIYMTFPMKYQVMFSLFFESIKIDYVSLISETKNAREFLVLNIYIKSDKSKTLMLDSYKLKKQENGVWVDDSCEPSVLSIIIGNAIESFRKILYN
jgi:hypothetical protein